MAMLRASSAVPASVMMSRISRGTLDPGPPPPSLLLLLLLLALSATPAVEEGGAAGRGGNGDVIGRGEMTEWECDRKRWHGKTVAWKSGDMTGNGDDR